MTLECARRSRLGMALADVPDEVFAQAMAGDGVAIDPTSDVVCAPFDGVVVPVGDARHAVTVRAVNGVEVLIHVGHRHGGARGQGIRASGSTGRSRRSGAPLLRFDMDAVAREAKSLVTPVVLSAKGSVTRRATGRKVAQGEVLFEVESGEDAGAARAGGDYASRKFRVPFDHGLHVRPAALIAAALKPHLAEVELVLHGRSGNARSSVALMALGARCGDTVEARATGSDALGALEALASVLSVVVDAPERAESPRASTVPGRIEGVVASRGVSVGVAARMSQRDEPVIEAGAGAKAEARALRSALDAVEGHLASLADSAQGPRRDLLLAHAELLRDPALTGQANDLIRAGKSAAFAWRSATRASAQTLAALEDARMNERAADLRDLERQVLRALRGEVIASAHELAPQSVVIADDLMPSQAHRARLVAPRGHLPRTRRRHVPRRHPRGFRRSPDAGRRGPRGARCRGGHAGGARCGARLDRCRSAARRGSLRREGGVAARDGTCGGPRPCARAGAHARWRAHRRECERRLARRRRERDGARRRRLRAAAHRVPFPGSPRGSGRGRTGRRIHANRPGIRRQAGERAHAGHRRRQADRLPAASARRQSRRWGCAACARASRIRSCCACSFAPSRAPHRRCRAACWCRW
jgi:phosphotransferase system HPr (HPr) family protein